MVSADFSLRHCGLPCLALWWTLLPHKPPLMFHEDNQAMIRICETGRNPTMRYLLRTHRVSVAWLHETFSREYIRMFYEDSSKMCADIYTKAFTDLARWLHACSLINVIDPAQLAAFCSKGSDASAAPAIPVLNTVVNNLPVPSHGGDLKRLVTVLTTHCVVSGLPALAPLSKVVSGLRLMTLSRCPLRMKKLLGM